jgi:hypothetical protein
MVYCTLIYGKDWHEKFARNIVEEAQKHNIYILTSHPEYFNGCEFVEKYSRTDFCYYEKLPWVFSLTKKLKQRVTYVDADWVFGLTNTFEGEDNTAYTNQLTKIYVKGLTPSDQEHIRDVFVKAVYPFDDNNYLSEKIISLPYVADKIDKMIEDIRHLQPFFESGFNAYTNLSKKFVRYKGVGTGYAEGAALTAVLDRYNIKYDSKRKLIRRKDRIL